MELMFAWFWLVKLGFSLIVLYVGYTAMVTKKFKSKVWNVSLIALAILMIVSPVKIKPQTDNVNERQSVQIEQTKVLPDMKSDNSFNKSTKIIGITKQDLK